MGRYRQAPCSATFVFAICFVFVFVLLFVLCFVFVFVLLFVLLFVLCICYGRLPVQQLEHQLQSLSLILADHLRALCQDRVLEGRDEDLSHIDEEKMT